MGTSPDRVLYKGEREEVVRPRVRSQSNDGASHEFVVEGYRFAIDPEHVKSQLGQAIEGSVRTHSVEEIKPSSFGAKQSNLSRMCQEAGNKFVEKLRGKELTSTTWCGL